MMTFPVSLVRKSQKHSSNSNKTVQNIGHMGVQIKLVSPKIYYFCYEHGILCTDLECPQSWDSHTSSISNKYSGKFQFRWASGHKDTTAGRFVTSSYIHMFWDKFMQNPPQTHCFPLQIFPCFTTLKCMLIPLRSTFSTIFKQLSHPHPAATHPSFLAAGDPQARWGRCPVVSYPNLGSTNPGCQWKMKVYRSIELLIGIW